MSKVAFEVAIVFFLLLANGAFAMAEIAVVSSRKSHLRRLADRANRNAKTALELAESPNRFLSTVQIGITLVGIFAGAFGEATLTAKLAERLGQIRLLAHYAEEIAFCLVVCGITYFSLVLGELVPKRLALNKPEAIAMLVAGPMDWLSRIAKPIVSFLSFSTDALLRLLGVGGGEEVTVSEDEVRVMVQEGVRAGAFNKVKRQIVESSLKKELMGVNDIRTSHPQIRWLIDAMVDVRSVEKTLPGFKFSVDAAGDAQTLAGYVVNTLGHVPKQGETFEAQDYVFEVMDANHDRVDRILVMRAKGESFPALP